VWLTPTWLCVTRCNVTLSNRSTAPLTELQQAILEFLWSDGPATAEQIREALRPRHPLKDPSVRTLLRRLEARGYVAHRTEGKVFVYRTLVPRRSVAAGAVQQIIERFWSGSVDQFLVGMVDEKVLSLRQLQRLAERVRKEE
jgi:BlaI family transcriptional regulator, penicillinase repressor